MRILSNHSPTVMLSASETSPGAAGRCSLSRPVPASPEDSSQARNDDVGRRPQGLPLPESIVVMEGQA